MIQTRNLTLTEFLAHTQLWQGLNSQQLQAIADIALPQSYNRGEIIFSQGDEGNGFFLVKTGKVKVFKISVNGKEQTLKIFKSGEHFAEVPAFDGEYFPASAIALKSSRLLFFTRKDILKLLEAHPKIAINMLSIFAHRLRFCTQKIEDLSFKTVGQRLAGYLLNLSYSIQRTDENAIDVINLDVNKKELAFVLGTIPETISRMLYKLSNEEIIALDGNKIYLLNREKLEHLAQGIN